MQMGKGVLTVIDPVTGEQLGPAMNVENFSITLAEPGPMPEVKAPSATLVCSTMVMAINPGLATWVGGIASRLNRLAQYETAVAIGPFEPPKDLDDLERRINTIVQGGGSTGPLKPYHLFDTSEAKLCGRIDDPAERKRIASQQRHKTLLRKRW